jgi:hypothetical protein
MSRFKYQSFKEYDGKELKLVSYAISYDKSLSAWLQRQDSFYSLSVFFCNRMIFTTTPVTRALTAVASKIRDFFPRAYRISLWSCDTQNYYASFKLLTYNRWHEQKMFDDIERSADHWSARDISLAEYFKEPPTTKC